MRKTREVTIAAEGRDQGKTFVITEMAASKAEKWGYRALSVAMRGGVDVGNAINLGMQGVAMIGIGALLSGAMDEAEPLLDEMMSCVKIRVAPVPGHPPTPPRDLWEEDIEEVATLLQLRQEVFQLHTGFWMAGAASKSTSETPAMKSSSSNTSTSPA